MLYYTILYSTVLYYTILYYTILYNHLYDLRLQPQQALGTRVLYIDGTRDSGRRATWHEPLHDASSSSMCCTWWTQQTHRRQQHRRSCLHGDFMQQHEWHSSPSNNAAVFISLRWHGYIFSPMCTTAQCLLSIRFASKSEGKQVLSLHIFDAPNIR